MKKGTKLVALLTTLCIGFSTGVLAAENETISAILNRTINVTYNGVAQSFSDANGTTVYPISYNGSTYLPVRSISELFGVAVDWDNDTETVILGSTEQQPTSLVSLTNTGGTNYSTIIRDVEDLTVSGDSATQTFSTGVKWHQWNSTSSYSTARGMFFDVTGYTTLTFTVHTEADSKIGIYDSNGDVLTTFELEAGTMATKTINIAGCTSIAFGSDGLKYGDNGYVKFLDPIVS